jgi:2-oxo-4-hydroxy-4-carboxy-5-ureidoimidazoline decarboxylase
MDASTRLDQADLETARDLLARCCGATRWVDAMLARRPFGSDERLLLAAREIWFALDEADWREAFAHHPKIGDRQALRQRFPPTATLSAREQSGVDGAKDDVLGALEAGNRAYEERFGYIFIVCATGKSADEMLARLEARLPNPPQTEIRVAAEEQARITALRLLAVGSAHRPPDTSMNVPVV